MVSGSIAGLFATTVGGVPKPRVNTLEVTTLGIRNEIIRDKKHHGGMEKAVCLMSSETMEHLQSLGHPIVGGSTGENLLLNIPQESLKTGVQLKFDQVQLEITMAASPCKTIAESFTSWVISTNYQTRNTLDRHAGMLASFEKESSMRENK